MIKDSTEKHDNLLGLADFIRSGRPGLEHHISALTANIAFRDVYEHSGVGIVKISTKYRKLPYLDYTDLFVAAVKLNKKVVGINLSLPIAGSYPTSFDVITEDTDSTAPPPDKIKIYTLAETGNARLMGTPGTNILILTTSNPAHRNIEALTPEQIEETKTWITEKGLAIQSEHAVSLLANNSDINIESVVFIMREKK
jgi:hypothetical protein